MVLQNRLGIGGLFFYFTSKKPTKNTHVPKKIVKGRSQIKSFYIFFLNCHKNLGSGIQMVGKPKILADNPKCRAWLSAG